MGWYDSFREYHGLEIITGLVGGLGIGYCMYKLFSQDATHSKNETDRFIEKAKLSETENRQTEDDDPDENGDFGSELISFIAISDFMESYSLKKG